MQISTANLLIASQQGKPAPRAEPSQSFASVLAPEKQKSEKPQDDFAPLSFKTIEKPAVSMPASQPSATPYGAPATLGSQLNIVI